MKRSMFMLSIASAAALTSCDKKTTDEPVTGDETKSHTATMSDTVNKPKVNIQVNRRYDGKGNLIGFDSTYSSFYSNRKGDTAEMDSLMHSFDRYFQRSHSSFLDRQFNPLFFNDSLRYPDFFHNDFFMKRYELNDQYLKETMKSMDSIKNRFFQEHSKKWKNGKDT